MQVRAIIITISWEVAEALEMKLVNSSRLNGLQTHFICIRVCEDNVRRLKCKSRIRIKQFDFEIVSSVFALTPFFLLTFFNMNFSSVVMRHYLLLLICAKVTLIFLAFVFHFFVEMHSHRRPRVHQNRFSRVRDLRINCSSA